MSVSNSRFSLFTRGAAPDAVLVLIASALALCCVSFAFQSAPDLRGNIALELALCAPMVAILFAGSWSKRAVPFSALGAVAYAGVLVAWGVASSGAPLFVDGAMQDTAENNIIFALLAALVPVLVFLLSRRRVLLVGLLAASIVACGAVQFMYRAWVSENHGAVVVLALLAVEFALFIYQGYKANAAKAVQFRRPAFTGAALFGLGAAAAACALGALVFVALVAPLGISTPHIKPFRDYYIPPTVEYMGVSDDSPIDDPETYSNNTNGQTDDTNQNTESTQGVDQNASTLDTMVSSLMSTIDPDSWQEDFNRISYNLLSVEGILSLLAVLAAIVALVLLWRYRRVLRLKRLGDEPYERRVLVLTDYLVRSLAKLGFKKPPSVTPLDWAFSVRSDMVPFTRGTGGVDFVKVTLLAQRVKFGGEKLAEEDYALVERYYRAFFANARRHVGFPKWLVMFWRV